MTIKRAPDDFVVEEQLTEHARSAVEHKPAAFTLYRLQKVGLTTPQAIAELAKALRLPAERVAFVGLKDKHARTRQYLTVPARRGQPGSLRSRGWWAQRMGWMDQPFDADMVAGNRFAIIVRQMNDRQMQWMERALRFLLKPDAEAGRGGSSSGSLLLVNYFGDQRFGSARHRQGPYGGFTAPLLIRGEFEQALKLTIATRSSDDPPRIKALRRTLAERWGHWTALARELPQGPELTAVQHLCAKPQDFRGAFAALPYLTQQMAVYAYQSHLWNAVARRLVQLRCAEPGPVIEADDDFGPLLFPGMQSIPQELRDLNLPVPGRKTEPAPPWDQIAAEVLQEEGLESFERLKIPGLHRPFFGEASRPFIVEATGFHAAPPQPDDDPHSAKGSMKRKLTFHLPRGAYATVLLRALGQ